MVKEEMLKTQGFKELAKQLLIEESYGACDIRLHYEQFGLKFKQRASDEEIETRIDEFIKRKTSKNNN